MTTAANYTETFPPQKAKSIPLHHAYEVENIAIKYWTGSAWADYPLYEALTSLAGLPFINPSDLTNKKQGYWQMQTPNTYNKLRLLAQTPISYTTQMANPTPLEDFGITYQSIFCEDEDRQSYCQRWDKMTAGTTFAANQILVDRNLLLRVDRVATIKASNQFSGINAALSVIDGSTIELFFNQSAVQINLKLSSAVSSVTIEYYQRQQTTTGQGQAPAMTWSLIHAMTKTPSQLNSAINYQNFHELTDKVVISIPENANAERGYIHLYLHEVCWETVSQFLYNQTLVNQATVQAETNELLEGLNKVIQPIWRPNTKYVIQVKVKDTITGGANMIYETYHNYGFSTKGSIGHFHQHDAKYLELPDTRKDQYPLADLRAYVDYSKSYPNADGNLFSAKPLFYKAPKLNLFFVKPYVYTMFNDFDTYNSLTPVTSALEAVIKDPIDQPSTVNSGTQQAAARWLETHYNIVEQDVQMLNNLMVNGQPCVQTTIINPPNVYAELATSALKPKKTYTAIFNSKFGAAKAEVLRYVFETSRYANFKEQVESYLLSANRKAIYTITINGVDTNVVLDIMEDNLAASDVLRRDFAHPFDRLLYVLGLPALEVPMTTEFNIVTDGDQNYGLLVRSPEPFNDPKIPASILIAHLGLHHDDIAAADFRVLVSKDGASLFITTIDVDIDDGKLEITLPYLEFDGQVYQLSSHPEHQAPVVVIEY